MHMIMVSPNRKPMFPNISFLFFLYTIFKVTLPVWEIRCLIIDWFVNNQKIAAKFYSFFQHFHCRNQCGYNSGTLFLFKSRFIFITSVIMLYVWMILQNFINDFFFLHLFPLHFLICSCFLFVSLNQPESVGRFCLNHKKSSKQIPTHRI